jgi:hypothetical protein
MKKRPLLLLGFLLAAIGFSSYYLFRNPPNHPAFSITSLLDSSSKQVVADSVAKNTGDAPPPNDISNSTQRDVLSLPTVITAVAGIILLVFLFSHISLRRRQQLLRSPHLVTPENFFKWTENVGGGLESVATVIGRLSEEVKASTEAHQKATNDLAATFLSLNKAIDQRDQQIRRAEQGWELHLFKRFLIRFSRVDQTLNDNSMSDSDILIQARELMADALNECDVYPLYPEIGSDFRKANGVDDRPLLVPTTDGSLYYQIKRVVTPGYRLRSPNQGDVVVIPAKVEIYSPTETING